MRLIKIIILFIPFLSFISCSSQNNIIYVNYVYDGDTFYDNKNNRYRLFGIDTPENKNSKFEKTKGLEQVYANLAKEKLLKQILFKEIRIEKIKIDRYKRHVVKIFVKNIDISLLLLKSGLARVAYIDMNKRSPFYSSDFNYYQILLDEQYKAYKNNLGIWKHKKYFKLIFPKS